MIRRLLAVSAMTVLMGTSLAVAQVPPEGGPGGGGPGGGGPGGGGGGRGNGGGGGNFDPAQMQQRMIERQKEELGVTDEEWTVLQPKIEKIQTLNRDLQSGAFGGMGGRQRGGANAQPAAAQGDVAKAAAALRETLTNKDSSAEDVAAKLQALRDARTKVKGEIEEARKDLKSLVTPRQEAALALQGVLE